MILACSSGDKPSLPDLRCYINHLPPELLVVLFKLVRGPGRRPWYWLRLLQVCRHWHAVALSAATLWSNISGKSFIFDPKPDFIQLCFARSREAPLTVTFVEGDISVTRHLPLLHPHVHRLQALHLYRLSQEYIQQEFLSCAASEYPSLAALTLDAQDGTPSPVVLSAERFPALRTLRLEGAFICSNSSVLPHLTTLSLLRLGITKPALALILSKCEKLEKLLIDRPFNRPRNGLKVFNVPAPWSLKDANPFSCLQKVELVDWDFRQLRSSLATLDLVGIPSAIARQPFETRIHLKNAKDGYDGDEDAEAQAYLLRHLANFALSSDSAPVRAEASLNPDMCSLTVALGSLTAVVEYAIKYRLFAHNRRGGSDLDYLGRILRRVPVQIFELHYTRRWFCAYEPRWREFLATVPRLRVLRVEGPWYRARGAELVVRALRPLPLPEAQGEASAPSEERADSRSASSRVVCPKLTHVELERFRTKEELKAECIEMVRARKALVPPGLKHLRFELPGGSAQSTILATWTRA
ncbi:hypothetical protein C8Q76DRAFT_801544 [Earliella scabrosa]|nr:hypothetical protein C8Q76DRAFT_801544 [Earliella scabrosa]